MNVLEIMKAGPVIPVIVVHRLEQAVPMCRALVEGGVRILEITLRTEAALHAIEAVASSVPGAIVGAGTISRPEDFAAARRAGAVFGVSPGLTDDLLSASQDSGLPLLPGVMTPAEVIRARNAGFSEMKLFPALQAGGVGMLKALGGPFPQVCFCPTGGITAETAPEYLALPNVGCVGGSWLTPADAVARNDWDRIRQLAASAAGLRRSPSPAQ